MEPLWSPAVATSRQSVGKYGRRGTRENKPKPLPWVATSCVSNAPVSEQMIELGTEAYYRSSFYRLGALRLIEVPLHPYDVAARAAWEESEPHDDTGE